uniref:Beta-defensin n=1 Tax=Gopherus evgoodei TaxID=1825980 RepID=A0A8C4W4T3_9SAUR
MLLTLHVTDLCNLVFPPVRSHFLSAACYNHLFCFSLGPYPGKHGRCREAFCFLNERQIGMCTFHTRFCCRRQK